MKPNIADWIFNVKWTFIRDKQQCRAMKRVNMAALSIEYFPFIHIVCISNLLLIKNKFGDKWHTILFFFFIEGATFFF